MSRTGTRLDAGKRSHALRVLIRITLTIFVSLCIIFSGSLCFGQSLFGPARWDAALMFLGLFTTWVTLCRDLPGQNVLLASIIIMAIASGFEVMAIMAKASTLVLQATLFWPVATIWVISILNARGVARIMLVRWRAAPTYGFWLFGLTIFLAVLFIFGSQYLRKSGGHGPLGTLARPNLWGVDVHGINLLKVAGTAVVSVLLVSPALVNKRPQADTVTVEPIIIWLGFNIVFVAATYSTHAFFEAILLFLSNVSILSVAIASRSNSPT